MNMRHTLLALIGSALVLSGCGREAGEAHSHENESHEDGSHEGESHEHDEHAEEPSDVSRSADVAKEVGIVTAPAQGQLGGTPLDLPAAARGYVDRVQELVGLRVSVVSVGPDRDQTIRV